MCGAAVVELVYLGVAAQMCCRALHCFVHVRKARYTPVASSAVRARLTPPHMKAIAPNRVVSPCVFCLCPTPACVPACLFSLLTSSSTTPTVILLRLSGQGAEQHRHRAAASSSSTGGGSRAAAGQQSCSNNSGSGSPQQPSVTAAPAAAGGEPHAPPCAGSCW